MQTNLFLIVSDDADGESLDLVVEARNENEAVNLWHSWLQANDLGGYGSPEEAEESPLVSIITPEAKPTPPRRVFRLPRLTGTERYFNWGEAVEECDL